MAVKLADTLAPMGDFPAAKSNNIEITLSGGTKKSIQKAYEDGDLGGGSGDVDQTYNADSPRAQSGKAVAEAANLLNQRFTNGVTWIGNRTGGAYSYLLTKNKNIIQTSLGYYFGIRYSIDNGKTFMNSNVTEGVYESTFLAQDGTVLAGGTNVGIKYSIDDGKTWNDSNISTGSVRLFGLAQDGTILAIYSHEILHSSDNGKTWESSTIEGSSIKFDSFLCSRDGTLYAGDAGGGGKRSVDNGLTWVDGIPGLSSSAPRAFIQTPSGTIIAACNNGVYRFNSLGPSFVRVLSAGTSSNLALAQNGTLIVDSSTGISYSTDDGATWVTSNITLGSTLSFYVLKDGTIVTYHSAGESADLIYSLDDGKTWEYTNADIDIEQKSSSLVETTSSDIIMSFYPTEYTSSSDAAGVWRSNSLSFREWMQVKIVA